MYNVDMQKLFVSMVLSSPDLFVKCKKIFLPEFFAPELRRDVEYILDHDVKFKNPPSVRIVNTEFDTEYESVSDIKESDRKWFLDTFEQFARRMALTNAVTQSASMIRDSEYDGMMSLISSAMQVGLDTDFGLNYSESPKERLENIKLRSGNMSSGFIALDRAFGKVNRGDLIIFAGGSGTGKSLFLQNLSRINWEEGLNVVYFTLELHPELCARRMDAMLLNKSTDDLYNDLDSVDRQVKAAASAGGDMRIVYRPSGTKTSEIASYIEDYISETGKRIDVLCVDYLDLLSPVQKVNVGDTFHKDKYVAEELRNIMQQYDILCYTASQTNRNAVDSTDGLNHSHIAGGISKINTADMVLGIISDPQAKVRGVVELQAMKLRNGAGTGNRIKLKYNSFTMRIEDDQDFLATLGNSNGYAPPPSQTPLGAAVQEINNLQNILNSNNKDYTPVDAATGIKIPNGMVGNQSIDRMAKLHNLLRGDDVP